MKNHWFYKQRGRKILKNHWFYCKTSPSHGSGPWPAHTRRICYEEPLQTSCLGKNVDKPLVLLCFRSKMLKNHWFYCVFLTFSFKNVKKPLVLLCFRSKMLKNHWFYKQRGRTNWTTIGFTAKPDPATASTHLSTDSGSAFAILGGWVMRNPYSLKLFRESTPKIRLGTGFWGLDSEIE